MGAHTSIQLKITIGTLCFSLAMLVFKYVYIGKIEPTLTETFEQRKDFLLFLGYQVKTQADGTLVFDWWPSFEFEILCLILLGLLISYLNG